MKPLWAARTVCCSSALEVFYVSSQGCVSFHRDGAGGSDEGQAAHDTNAPVPGSSTKSSQNHEELSDHELDEYDLDKYNEEEYTGKKNLCVRCAV